MKTIPLESSRGFPSATRFESIALAVVVVVLLAAHPGAVAGETQRPPNVIVILADDLGWQGIGSYGLALVPTPRIDSIGKEGIRFTDGYVAAPLCSPSRAGLLTGRSPARLGHEANKPGHNADQGDKAIVNAWEAKINDDVKAAGRVVTGLDRNAKTMADRLKALGCTTGLIGKWHLGDVEGYLPNDRGFDYFWGHASGAYSYHADSITENRGEVPMNEHLTVAEGKKCAEFIARNKEMPFFLYASFYAPHNVLWASPEQLARFSNIPEEGNRRVLAANLALLDEAVGRILDALRENGLDERTLVFFLSDNGPQGRAMSAVMGNGLRGAKFDTDEGGIRVPFMARWKGRIPDGRVVSEPVSALDILPTVLAAAGGAVTPDMKLDGVNLLPLLEGKVERLPARDLCWRYGDRRAIRNGDWKLSWNERSDKPALYQIASDPKETKDQAASHPEIVESLQKAWNDWNKENIPCPWLAPTAACVREKPTAPPPGYEGKRPGQNSNDE